MFRWLLIVGALAGCAGQEGDRCNSQEVNPMCGDGLACVAPPNCPAKIFLCCPTDRAPADPRCGACPAPDLGAVD